MSKPSGPTKRLLDEKKLFKAISRLPPKAIPALIKHLSPKTLHALTEGVVNLLQGNIPLNKHELNRLRPYKKALRNICQASQHKFKASKVRALYQNQRGGFLPAILFPILKAIGTSALGAAAGGIVKKIVGKK